MLSLVAAGRNSACSNMRAFAAASAVARTTTTSASAASIRRGYSTKCIHSRLPHAISTQSHALPSLVPRLHASTTAAATVRAMSYLRKRSPSSPPAAATSTAAATAAAAVDKSGTNSSAPSTDDTYDVIVIGGGSGGLAFSKEASGYGQSVCVIDYVAPSPAGSQWGLGGTCVNVGCIPKKLMHHAAIIGEKIEDASSYGWKIDVGKGQNKNADTKEKAADAHTAATTATNATATTDRSSSSPPSHSLSHSWSTLVDNVQSYIRSLNFGYRSRLLKDPRCTYVNARAEFVDSRTVRTVDRKGVERLLRAKKHIVIAVGGRPSYPPIAGAKECGITSDDIFSLPSHPGKTLIVGAGYIALETAGLLSSLNVPTTVMSRDKYLRGFDQSIANMIVEHMARHGTRFIQQSVPVRLEKTKEGKIRVEYMRNPHLPPPQQQQQTSDAAGATSTAAVDAKQTMSEEFDTVLFATGRHAETQALQLQRAGVKTVKSGKIIVDLHLQRHAAADTQAAASTVEEKHANASSAASTTTEKDPDETTASGVYAIGDVAVGRPELTPVAIASARMLARRLYGKDAEAMVAQQQQQQQRSGVTATQTHSSHAHSHAHSHHHSHRDINILDYSTTPTTVFTPLEYACVGWSEDHALSHYSGDSSKIEVYHAYFQPLEWTLPQRESNACYVKIVCTNGDEEAHKQHSTGATAKSPSAAQPSSRPPSSTSSATAAATSTDATNDMLSHHSFLSRMHRQRVLGLHFLGPNAGEVMQGFAAAFRKGLTRADLEYTIGIHPTSAEELVSADITKSSGRDPQKTGC